MAQVINPRVTIMESVIMAKVFLQMKFSHQLTSNLPLHPSSSA